MNEEKAAVEQRFYEECARLLGTTYAYKPWAFRKRTRWNNRGPGNGRFTGHGLIRLFGNTVHVSLYNPKSVNRFFPSTDAALGFLETIYGRDHQEGATPRGT
jgi:hypothetical protein